MGSLVSFVRWFDFSQASVGLRHKQSDTYASLAGGICSLLIVFLITSYGLLEMIKVFETPQKLKERTQSSYLTASNNTEIFQVSTDDLIPALQIIDSEGVTQNTTKYLVPYLAIATRQTDPETGQITSSNELIQMELCTDLYQSDDSGLLLPQFSPYQLFDGANSYDWYCADTDKITVQNDPRTNQNGIAANFVINYCDYAVENLGLDDDTCVMDHTEIDSISKKWLINTKTVSRFFNPNTYSENGGKMDFAQAVQKTGLFEQADDRIPQMDFTLHQTLNYERLSKWIDYPSDSTDAIPTYQAAYQQTSFVRSTMFDVKTQGVFQIYFSQDPEITSKHYTSEYTVLGAFALIGGAISSYYYAVLFTMANYTRFKYENELARNLYKTTLKPETEVASSRGTLSMSGEITADKQDMTSAILSRRSLPQYNYLSYVRDWFVVTFCCCLKRSGWYRNSLFKRKRHAQIRGRLQQEVDLLQVLQQLRILQFMATVQLRRNQAELVPYSAMYTLVFGDQDRKQIKQSHDFKFNAELIRTVPQLLRGFEARTDIFDRQLLYFLTGRQEQECMQGWIEDEDVSYILGTSEVNTVAASMQNFEKYLSAVPEDLDLDLSDYNEENLNKILLLPNGRTISIANESLLTGSLDKQQLRLLGLGRRFTNETSPPQKDKRGPGNPLLDPDMENDA